MAMGKVTAAWADMSSAARAVALGGLVLPVVLVTAVAVTAVGLLAPRPRPLRDRPTDPTGAPPDRRPAEPLVVAFRPAVTLAPVPLPSRRLPPPTRCSAPTGA